MKLVIVESPTKARTLGSFLPKDYQIEATLGHVRDLPKKRLGIDVEKDFKATYVLLPGKEERIKELKKQAKKASKVILATDSDREGEAIAYHVARLLLGKRALRSGRIFSSSRTAPQGGANCEQRKNHPSPRSQSEISDLKVDGLFIEVGKVPSFSLASQLKIKVNPKNYVLVDANMKTNIPGVFACGDLCLQKNQMVLCQFVVSAADGARAAASAYQYLTRKDPGASWGKRTNGS
jgi:hypothetical protein